MIRGTQILFFLHHYFSTVVRASVYAFILISIKYGFRFQNFLVIYVIYVNKYYYTLFSSIFDILFLCVSYVFDYCPFFIRAKQQALTLSSFSLFSSTIIVMFCFIFFLIISVILLKLVSFSASK